MTPTMFIHTLILAQMGDFLRAFTAIFGGFCTTVFDEIAVFGRNVCQPLQE